MTSDDKHLFKSIDDARKAATNAINRYKYAYKKKGIEFKYIYAVEYKNARNKFKQPIFENGVQMIRMHIHMIVPAGLTIVEMRKPWQLGRTIQFEPLRDYKEGQISLAIYLSKDPKDGHRRWASSKNLKQPIETIAYRKKFASKKKVQAIAANENLRPLIFENIYEDYEFLESETLYNEVNDGTYLYIKMRKKIFKKGKCS